MTGRDKLKELAVAHGISEKTAYRYLKAGVDLNDPEAVEAHKCKVRTRRGVSKFSRRTLREPVKTPAITLEAVVKDLEEIICSVYWLAVESPEPGGKLAAEIIERTRHVIDRIGGGE
jgi:hypothetical protein